MNKKSLIALIIVVVVFIGAFAFYIYATNKSNNTGSESTTAQENTQTIPQTKENDFSFVDKDGIVYNFKDFEEKPIALLLWSSDSDGAIELIEKYATYIPKYEDKVEFIILNTGEKNNEIISLAENAGLGIKLYYNQDSSAMEYFGISKLPYMMFISQDGHVDQEKALEDMDRDLDDYLSANLDLLSGVY